MSLKYEPASEPLHISVEWLFLRMELYLARRSVCVYTLALYLAVHLRIGCPLTNLLKEVRVRVHLAVGAPEILPGGGRGSLSYLSIYLSTSYLSIYLSVHCLIYLSISSPSYLSIYLPVHCLIYLSICSLNYAGDN